MAHGGSRPGTGGKRPRQGRPKAATTVKTRALADELMADGKPLPLTVLINRMRALAALEDEESQHQACQIANMCAPYLHPRLQPRPYRAISLALPALDSFDNIAKAHAVVAKAMATGALDADAARALTQMLGSAREALEATAFEARLAALENQLGARS
jgi:hypothetical protein